MSFLNPILLAGLAAVSVPIIIHLLNRRKFQKVVWAAMRFLKVSVEQNQRRMRIEDLILLALRCLLIALLALALARPALKTLASAVLGAKVTAVIILDNSYSMAMSDGTASRFDKAKKAALQALESMPLGSATAVLLASDTVQPLVPEPTFDLSLARRMIQSAPLTDRTTDLWPAIRRALQTLEKSLALRKEIYLLTDGQSSGWRHLSDIQTALDRAAGRVRAHIVFVGEHEDRNLGLSELRLASGLTPVKQPLRFEVRVTNYGKQPVSDVRVALHVDSDPPSDEFVLDTLAPGATRSVSLFARLRTEGFHSVTARLPEDRLPADDKRTLALRALRETRVLLVDGEPGAEPRESETFFLRHALVPVPPDEAPAYHIKPTILNAAELETARFDDFDAVILANVPEMSATAAQALAHYVRRGGGLLIFPGGRVKPVFYNQVLAQRHHLLPATLGAPRGLAEQDEKFFTLQTKDFEHPIVVIWNDPASGTLASARFYRAYDLVPVAVDAPVRAAAETKQTAGNGDVLRPSPEDEVTPPQTVLRYADGRPAVMSRDVGLGRVVLFSSTADTAWNDLPVRLAFVPLIHRTLGAVVARQDEGLNVRVGETFHRRAPTDLLGKEALVTKPRQTDVLRDSRRIEMRGGWPAFQYDQTDFAGTYELTVPDAAVALKFAAQADPQESWLDELSAEQKQRLAAVASVLEWGPNFSLKTQVERERSGSELWLPFLLAALVVAVLESALAQWFSRSK